MPVTRITVDVDIPEGYEYERYALPKTGDIYLRGHNSVANATFDWCYEPQFILKKVPVWKDATVDDVNPYNPKECRVRDDNYQEWRHRKLMGVVANTFFTATEHNLSGTYKYCQVKE